MSVRDAPFNKVRTAYKTLPEIQITHALIVYKTARELLFDQPLLDGALSFLYLAYPKGFDTTAEELYRCMPSEIIPLSYSDANYQQMLANIDQRCQEVLYLFTVELPLVIAGRMEEAGLEIILPWQMSLDDLKTKPGQLAVKQAVNVYYKRLVQDYDKQNSSEHNVDYKGLFEGFLELNLSGKATAQ